MRFGSPPCLPCQIVAQPGERPPRKREAEGSRPSESTMLDTITVSPPFRSITIRQIPADGIVRVFVTTRPPKQAEPDTR